MDRLRIPRSSRPPAPNMPKTPSYTMISCDVIIRNVYSLMILICALRGMTFNSRFAIRRARRPRIAIAIIHDHVNSIFWRENMKAKIKIGRLAIFDQPAHPTLARC